MELKYVSMVRLPTGRAHGYAIMKMCEQFAFSGAKVELIVPRRTHGIQEDPFVYYGIEKKFLIKKLWATDFLGKIEYARIPFAIDQMTFLLSILMRDFSDSILYTRDYQVALFARARKVILEIHSIPHRTKLFYRAVQRAHKIIVISNGLKHDLIENGVPSDKVGVAPDAADLSEFEVDAARDLWKGFGVDPSKKIALYTGHFYGWKGADTLAQAAAHLSSGIEVVLMGGVSQELADFQKQFGSQAHVIGLQPRERIPQILKSADVLILPNSAKPKISSHYTSPLKLFQYMAAGVPILASNLPSIREILNDENSYWFTPDDPRSLARQIEYVLSNPIEAAAKAARAKEDVKQYTWDARARSILAHIAK